MKKNDKKPLNTNNGAGIHEAENNSSRTTNDSVPFESDGVDKSSEGETSQLLSNDGWKTYQNELIRQCFELWEVNEPQGLANNNNNASKFDLGAGNRSKTAEPPSSLFAEKLDDACCSSRPTISDTELEAVFNDYCSVVANRIQNKDYLEDLDRLQVEYKRDIGAVAKRFYYEVQDAIGRKTKGNHFVTAANSVKKRIRKREFKTFSLCRQNKSDKRTNRTLLRSFAQKGPSSSSAASACSLEELWEYKQWLDLAERKTERDREDGARDLDAETDRMERKVREIVSLKCLEESNNDDSPRFANESAATAGGLRCFFKNAFRSNPRQDETACDAKAIEGELSAEGKSEAKSVETADVVVGDAEEKRLNANEFFQRFLQVKKTARPEAPQHHRNRPRHFRSWCGGGGTADSRGRTNRARFRRCLSDTDLRRRSSEPEDDGRKPREDPRGRDRRDEERQECFRAAVARLEYVGGAFRERCRPIGLKILCGVDVLAGFGRPAEAVRLFVRSALPLSDDAETMIRRAEVAYDWKFFCHLSMWRYSY